MLKLFDASDEVSKTFSREIKVLVGSAHGSVIELVGYSLSRRSRKAPFAARFAASCGSMFAVQIGTTREANGCLHDPLGRPPSLDDMGLAIMVPGIVVGMNFIHS